MFAGGTHIATQHEMNPATTSDDSLTFVTADPVTGSVARYSGSGASADIEESEPLGQMIETSDPGTGYPTSYEDVRGIARDPEWQCMLPKEFTGVFNEMPVHCKKAWLAESIYGIGAKLAESDPKRVAMPADGHGSPGRRTPPTLRDGQRLAPEHLAQMRALAATGKFDNEEDGPDCGLTDCVVNVEAQSDSFAAIDASISGIMQTQRTEPIPSKDDLRTLLTRRQDLYDGGCRKFLEQILRNVRAREISFEELYDNFTAKHGFAESGHSGGFSHVGKGDIGLPSLPAATNDAQKYQKQMKFVQTLIHELLHRIGKSHSDMARAAFDALTKDEQRNNRLPEGDSARSTFMTQMINLKCGFNPNDPAEVKANLVR